MSVFSAMIITRKASAPPCQRTDLQVRARTNAKGLHHPQIIPAPALLLPLLLGGVFGEGQVTDLQKVSPIGGLDCPSPSASSFINSSAKSCSQQDPRADDQRSLDSCEQDRSVKSYLPLTADGSESFSDSSAFGDNQDCFSPPATLANLASSSQSTKRLDLGADGQRFMGFRWADLSGTSNHPPMEEAIPQVVTDSDSDWSTDSDEFSEADEGGDEDFDFGSEYQLPEIPDIQTNWPPPFCSLPDSPLQSTPIDIFRWDELAESLPNQEAVSYVSRGLKEGFSLQFHPIPLKSVSRNMPSSYRNPEVIDSYLEEEVRLGRVAGPFSELPMGNLHINRFGVVPKKESDKFRLILDLSYPENASPNAGVSDEDASVSYEDLDMAIEAILVSGRGSLLSKFDIQSAYRLLPIAINDRYLLGMKWRRFFYVDLVLPFGSRVAPSIFTVFADVLRDIIQRDVISANIQHYLDDYLLISPPGKRREAMADFRTAKAICDFLGIPINEDKDFLPATLLPHLGIELDTVNFEARLPQDKVASILALINAWLSKGFGTKRDLISLHGKLEWASKVVQPGRPFLRSIIDRAHSVSKKHFFVRLASPEKEDLRWWSHLLTVWNGVSLFIHQKLKPIPDFTISSDAAGSIGFGIVYGSAWVAEKWPPLPLGTNIAILELIPIVISATIWGQYWSGKSVLFFCDNSAAVSCLKAGLCKDPHLSFLVRELATLAVIHSFRFSAEHVSGEKNKVSDALSRFNFQVFRSLRPWADKCKTEVPEGLILRLLRSA